MRLSGPRAVASSILRMTPPGRQFLAWRERRRFWAPETEDSARMTFYRTFVAAGDLVFDVGANRGSRSRLFHLLGARIVAFEPQPELASLLRRTFPAPRMRVVEAALGDAEGSTPMFISTADVLSSLSREWIAAVQQSGRFGGEDTWSENRQISVVVRTLDAVIREYGVPRFTKIDVEGYELPVLLGLNTALPALSFEFTSETLDSTVECVRRLASIGDYRFQVSSGESLRFDLPAWLTAGEMMAHIDTTLRQQAGGWGDLYARRAAEADAAAG